MPPSWDPITEERLSWAEAEALRTDNTALKEACATWREGEEGIWDKSATDALQVVNAFLNKPTQSEGPEGALAGNSGGSGSGETEASGSGVAEGPARKRPRRTEGALVGNGETMLNGRTEADPDIGGSKDDDDDDVPPLSSDDDDDDDQDEVGQGADPQQDSQVDLKDNSKVIEAMKMVNLSQNHHRGNRSCACDKDEDGFCEKISEHCKVVKKYNFDVCKMLKSAKDKIESIKHKEKLPFKDCQEFVGGGYTQSGKTAYKAALSILGKFCGVATVVITTTASNRDQLARNIEKLLLKVNDKLKNEKDEILCMSISSTTQMDHGKLTAKEHREKLKELLRKHGIVVVNLTAAQMTKIRELIAEIRGCSWMNFLLVKDESDTFDRRLEVEEYLKLEKALHQLTGKESLPGLGSGTSVKFGSPLLIFNVSATLLPIFMRVKAEGKDHLENFMVETGEEYSGLPAMEPTYLAHNELNHKNAYWSDTVEGFYRKAHPENESEQCEGVLLLDAVNPRVKAECNISDRAAYVRREFPRFTTITVSGSGGIQVVFSEMLEGLGSFKGNDELHVMLKKSANEYEESFEDDDEKPGSKKRSPPPMDDLLTAVVKLQGLQFPIAVIGYTRLLRGESYRSHVMKINGEDRCLVPTHMLCGLGEMRSVEDLVQMLGRATFNGRSFFEKNMGSDAKVQILIRWKDWDLAKDYYRFQDDVAKKLNEGKSLKDVLESEQYQSGAALRNMGKRTFGARPLKERNNLNQLKILDFLGGATGDGFEWARSKKFLSFTTGGQELRMESPIKDEDRTNSVEWADIEQHLYHAMNHKDPRSLLLRKALFLSKKAWEGGEDNQDDHFFENHDVCQNLWGLSYSTKGDTRPKVIKKPMAWHDGRAFCRAGTKKTHWWTLSEDGAIPFFIERQGQGFELHDEILRFARHHREALLEKEPLFGEEAFEEYVEQEFGGN